MTESPALGNDEKQVRKFRWCSSCGRHNVGGLRRTVSEFRFCCKCVTTVVSVDGAFIRENTAAYDFIARVFLSACRSPVRVQRCNSGIRLAGHRSHYIYVQFYPSMIYSVVYHRHSYSLALE